MLLAVRWYPHFALSFRDVEELLAQQGSKSTKSPFIACVLRFTPPLASAR
jgi:transposase-like protein